MKITNIIIPVMIVLAWTKPCTAEIERDLDVGEYFKQETSIWKQANENIAKIAKPSGDELEDLAAAYAKEAKTFSLTRGKGDKKANEAQLDKTAKALLAYGKGYEASVKSQIEIRKVLLRSMLRLYQSLDVDESDEKVLDPELERARQLDALANQSRLLQLTQDDSPEWAMLADTIGAAANAVEGANGMAEIHEYWRGRRRYYEAMIPAVENNLATLERERENFRGLMSLKAIRFWIIKGSEGGVPLDDNPVAAWAAAAVRRASTLHRVMDDGLDPAMQRKRRTAGSPFQNLLNR